MKGFTLVELVVTLAILGLLATMAAPLVSLAAQRSKEQDLRAALRSMREAIDAYHQAVIEGRVTLSADTNGYPKSLHELAEGVPDLKDPSGKKKLYFLRRIPRDPMSPLPADTPPEQTWGLRSYQSPPDDPQPGDDVYDVYSLSGKQGMNGVPYRQW
ncbi:MAG: type II secretion system protein [Thiobacillaceae bacterium]